MAVTVDQPNRKPHTKVIASTVGALVGTGIVAAAELVGVTVPEAQIAQLATGTIGAGLAGYLKREGHVPPEGDEPTGGRE